MTTENPIPKDDDEYFMSLCENLKFKFEDDDKENDFQNTSVAFITRYGSTFKFGSTLKSKEEENND